MYLSINEILANNLTTATPLSNETLTEMQSYGNPPLPPAPSLDLAEFFNTDPCSIKIDDFKPGVKALIKKSWQDVIDYTEEMFNNLIKDITALFVNLFNGIKDLAISIYKSILDAYNAVIEYFKGEYQRLILLWKKIKNKKDEEKNKKKLKDILIKAGKEIYDMFNLYVIVDTIVSLWEVMKNVWGTTKNGWKNLINKFKSAGELMSSDSDNDKIAGLVKLFKTLVPIIAALAAAVLAILACCKAQQSADHEVIKKVADELNELANDPDFIAEQTSYSDLSMLLSGGYKENNDISYNCYSVCPVDDNTSASQVKNVEGSIVEIALNYESGFSLTPKVGDTININDVIGYINNIPLKSEITGTVIERTDRHIVVKDYEQKTDKISQNLLECVYDEDIFNNIDSVDKKLSSDFSNINESLISTVKTKDDLLNLFSNKPNDETSAVVNELMEKLQRMNNVEYVFRNKYSILSNGLCYNKSKFENNIYLPSIDTEAYKVNSSIHEIIDINNNDILTLTSRNHVESQIKLNPNNLKTLKEQIINKKRECVTNIYNTLKNKTFFTCQKNANDDSDLLNTYFDYLTNGYDNDNEFDKELYYIIRDFYVERFSTATHNVNNIINNFNGLLSKNKCNTNFATLYKTYNDSDIETLRKIFETLLGVSTSRTESSFDPSTDLIYDEITGEYKASDEATARNEAEKSNANEERDKKILANALAEQYQLIIKIKAKANNNTGNNNDNNTYKNVEISVLNEFIDKLLKIYNEGDSILDENTLLKKLNTRIGWPLPNVVNLNNAEFKHYLFLNKNNTDAEDLSADNPINNGNNADDNLFNTKSRYTIDDYPYWLLYCANSTLINCMLPIYWGTGLIILGAPLPLPIILVPICYIPGKVGLLIGLGICGIAIWPMMLFVNMTSDMQSLLIPINIILEMLREMLRQLKNTTFNGISFDAESKIKLINKKINNINKQIKDIDKEILRLRSL